MRPKSKVSSKKTRNQLIHDGINWESSEDDEVYDNGENCNGLLRKIIPDIAVMSIFIQGTNYERSRVGAIFFAIIKSWILKLKVNAFTI